MKRFFTFWICLFAMMAVSTGLRAQGITITLNPSWTWISIPYTEPIDLETLFVDFEPMLGDMIESEYGIVTFDEDEGWFGDFSTLEPGRGYLYYSGRDEAIEVALGSPSSSVTVSTSEPMGINYYSAVCGGVVTVADGDHVFMRGVCYGTEPNPTIDDNHTTDEAGIGGWTVQVYGLALGTTYHVRAYTVTDCGLKYGEDFSFTTKNISGGGELDYVDLGLPSGILWATCNVGADAPEDYGDYFAWGETQPKDDYSWSTYQHCNGSYNTLTKYCNKWYGNNGFTDTLTVLMPEDDAASVNWGADWRMPTKEEWEELYQNTTVTWTTQNGVYGRLFTASSGNSIFLPVTGFRYDGSLEYADIAGYYWSSTLDTDYPDHAWNFDFGSVGYGTDTGCGRTYGLSVRPVRSPAPQHDHVDLGLPSGTLWATCNVGADAPEEYGYYFAWGETQPKDVYSWSNYQHCNGSYNTLTKYCYDYGYEGYTDTLTVLLPEDDAATANWGDDWRMPTIEEWEELYQNTTVTITTQNGINGCLFTAENGNSIFIPAAGGAWDNNFNNNGTWGSYWSSSLYSYGPYNAMYLSFYMSGNDCYIQDLSRNRGNSVRPVRSLR